LDFFAKHWGDLASIAGLAYAIYLAYWARTAAEQARDAAREARDRIFSLDVASELTAARLTLTDIIGLQRLELGEILWPMVLDRYERARLSLVRCEGAHGVPEAQRESIITAVGLLRSIVEDIETARIDPDQVQLDIVRINRFLSGQIDELERARIAIERVER
jgi:hypothetical protein